MQNNDNFNAQKRHQKSCMHTAITVEKMVMQGHIVLPRGRQ